MKPAEYVSEEAMKGIPLKTGWLPWTKSCFVCGAQNPHGLHLRSRAETDRVILDYTTREADVGYRHIVHGGILMTLMDEVMTWAAILAAQRICVAAEMTTRLVLPVSAGEQLRFEGMILRASPRLLLAESQVWTLDGDRLVAKASGKYAPMPSDQVKACADDFITGPDTLPLDSLFQGI